MISSNCDINEFLEEIGDKELYDIIFMANQEATEVERIALHSGCYLRLKLDPPSAGIRTHLNGYCR
jgi:hypothetical protein